MVNRGKLFDTDPGNDFSKLTVKGEHRPVRAELKKGGRIKLQAQGAVLVKLRIAGLQQTVGLLYLGVLLLGL